MAHKKSAPNEFTPAAHKLFHGKSWRTFRKPYPWFAPGQCATDTRSTALERKQFPRRRQSQQEMRAERGSHHRLADWREHGPAGYARALLCVDTSGSCPPTSFHACLTDIEVLPYPQTGPIKTCPETPRAVDEHSTVQASSRVEPSLLPDDGRQRTNAPQSPTGDVQLRGARRPPAAGSKHVSWLQHQAASELAASCRRRLEEPLAPRGRRTVLVGCTHRRRETEAWLPPIVPPPPRLTDLQRN